MEKKQRLPKLSGPEQVAIFLEQLEHPLKAEIAYTRRIILGADSDLTEQIKWNAPSFCVGGQDRITFNLQGKDGIRLIFHCGAKATEHLPDRSVIEDEERMLEWASDDRAIVKLKSMDEIELRKESLAKLVRQWIAATSPANGE